MARYALLVGVSRFADKRLPALNAPPADVQALADGLRDQQRGGFDHVVVSVDEEYLTLRGRLAELFDGRDPDDLVLFFYSGHGILSRGNRLFLATQGSDFSKPQVCSLSATEIREQMEQSRSQQQIVVLDCCHSGAFAPGAKAVAAPVVTDATFDTTASGRLCTSGGRRAAICVGRRQSA
jgi:uncharacterized caspase-like protein